MAPPNTTEEQSAPSSPSKDKSLGNDATETMGDTTGASGPDENEDPILAKLKRPARKKRNPNAKWDGRLAGMSVKEYRERKWSVDACYAKVERRGPSFSFRPSLPSSFEKKNNNFQVGDVFRSFNATLPAAPSCSMGVRVEINEKETSQGPAEYPFKSTMDPSTHPTAPKNRGARFGSEVLQPRDPPGPAPGNYEVDGITASSAIKTVPTFTIQGREAWRASTAPPGPDPGEYNFTGAMKHGNLTPIQWNMMGKLRAPQPSQVPGPHYTIPGLAEKIPVKNQAPLWKFGGEPRGLRG
jgi:hypothetical protein